MDPRTARRVSPPIAVAVALATVAVGSALLLSARDRLPGRIATHWGPHGIADGFQSLAGVVGTGAGLIIGLTLVMVALAVLTRQPSVAAVGSGMAVFMGVLMYGSALAQVGVLDPAAARMSNALMLAGFASGAVVGVVQAWLVRTKPGVAPYPRPAAPDGAVRAHVAGTARVAWSRQMRHGAITSVVPAAAVALLLGMAVWMWRSDGPWALMLVIAVVVAGLLIPLQLATVVVDASGVSLRVLGRTLRRTGLSQIRGARVVDVTILSSYGGVGYRIGFDGSQGYITSGGPALRLERFDAADLVFTVDGADQAASVVNTLIDRQAESES